MVCHKTYKDFNKNWLSPEEVDTKDGINYFQKNNTDKKVIVGSSESMSKSKKNTIDPEKIIENYGADAVRLFILSDSPPEKDVQWSEQVRAASYKFVQKLWGLHEKIKKNLNKNNDSKTDTDKISKFTNQLIHKINGNLERFNYNVFIANMYETYNFLNQKINNPINKKTLFENYRKVLSVMSPIIPHFASECLDDLKLNTFQKWPDVDKNMLGSETVEYVIQINGKKRSIINSKKDIDEKTLMKKIKKDQKIVKFLDGNNIIRSIFVKNRLINLIIK